MKKEGKKKPECNLPGDFLSEGSLIKIKRLCCKKKQINKQIGNARIKSKLHVDTNAVFPQ